MTLEARQLGVNPTDTDVWNLILDQAIIDMIVVHTNIKLTAIRQNLGENTNKSNYRSTDNVEINALFDLLLLSSILKSSNETVTSMFSKDGCPRPVFNASKSVKRFEILLSSLRFDDAQTRPQRKAIDKAAAISEIFNSHKHL